MITPFQNSGKSAPDIRPVAPPVGRPWAGAIVVIACLGLFVTESARAVDIPALSVIQPEIAAAHPELVKQRDALIKERKALLDRTNSHNDSCTQVEAGSAADASCTKAYQLLEKAINSHVQASKQYNDNYLAAVNLAAKPKPAPHTDTSVVDARNVPSGLPKALDNAIANAYSSAPPGVSDRVRKGFQAVMERDWTVAKVWFQDALNRDPTNAGLKRLVVMTDAPQQPIRQEAPVDNRNEPAGLGGKSDFKGAFATPSQTKPATVTPTDPNDMNVLLPGLKAMDKPTGTQSQRPDPNDMNVLFPDFKTMNDDQAFDYLSSLIRQREASESGKIK